MMGKTGNTTPAFLLVGFTAVIAQVVLMREMIVVFHGNELSLGLVLASWFLWTALGSGLAGHLVARAGNPRAWTAVLQALLSLAFPLGILGARFSRSAVGSLPGEILGPGTMLLISLAVLSLFCAVSGGLFAAASRLLASQTERSYAAATSSLYFLEAVGSGAGGLLAGLVLVRFLTPLEIAVLLGALNLISAASLGFSTALWRGAASLVALIAASFLFLGSGRLENSTLGPLWKGFSLLTARNSIYGNLAVVETGGSRSLYENGLVMSTAPDPAAAEEAVHYALLQHTQPRSLLLVGGGINGSLAQALRHPGLSRVDYVELDPSVIDLARGFFGEEWRPGENDGRLNVHFVDGRLFVKRAAAFYDVIIVNLPEPQTAQLNRFYTVEFFREAAARLAPGGVFSFQLAGSENYISPELAEFLRCINKTLREVFSDVVVLPGDPVHFFASMRHGTLTSDPGTLVGRLRGRGLETAYVREYYIPFRMTPDRIQDLESAICPQPDTPVNRDFAPIAYYFDISYWSARFAPAGRHWFQSLARIRFGVAAAAMGVFLLLLAGWLRRTGVRSRRAGAGLCVALMGFTSIALEMLVLLGFQSLYGYVYFGLSLLIAAFMVGMAAGSWFALRRRQRAVDSARTEMRSLALFQVLAGTSPLAMICLFPLLAGTQSSVSVALASWGVFPVLAFCSGLLGGLQFPRASSVFYLEAECRSGNVGMLYGLDLVGSCFGAIVLSVYLIPVFGFARTAILIALANLAPVVFVWRSSPEHL